MNTDNNQRDLRFFTGLIPVAAGTAFFIYTLLWAVNTKLGTLEGAIGIFGSLVGIWSTTNIIFDYLAKHKMSMRLDRNYIYLAVAVLITVVILVISHFQK